MHRDTEMARWYRRIDRRCFTGQQPTTTTEGANQQAARQSATLATTTNLTGWRALVNDRRAWSIEAVADRL